MVGFKPRAVYYYPDVDFNKMESYLSETVTISDGKKRPHYIQCPISFDIETTSFISSQLDKCAVMYAWAMSIDGYVILGRTWEDFNEIYDWLVDGFAPSDEYHLLIYVHNLAYEFQFMCHRFKWKKVFALEERKPIYGITTDNVEFRCSYQLSGYNLENVGKHLQRYKVEKLVGDLDYKLPRHTSTPLSEQEWQYLINDVQVVCAYIKETAENDGGYGKIPLTKTGYVRQYCRAECFSNHQYRKFIQNLTLNATEYQQLKQAFAGGFTHANWHHTNKVINNVRSYDFTSSYPYVMLSEKFPMSTSVVVPISSQLEMEQYMKDYCCVFDIKFTNINGWDAPDHLISLSKCRNVVNPYINNGRIITADSLETTITNVDFESLRLFYKWESFQVANFRIYEKAYLPYKFIKAILKLYQDKTELKNVEGREVDYMKAKEMINSCYGMTVTDIVRNEDTFIEEWESVKGNPEEQIQKYNANKNRFLFYPWGVFVTAYARRNLFTAIYEFQDDYVYSDTDSVKVINYEKHLPYIKKYNEEADRKLQEMCDLLKIDFSATRPKTITGKQKPLGEWDDEGEYTRFKTLGAKRYMTEKNGKINITVAGLAKASAVPYIEQLAHVNNTSMFDEFAEGMYIPVGWTGKLTHIYNDSEFSDYLTDYTGITELVHEYSSINLSPADYSLSLDSEFVRLMKGVKYIDA